MRNRLAMRTHACTSLRFPGRTIPGTEAVVANVAMLDAAGTSESHATWAGPSVAVHSARAAANAGVSVFIALVELCTRTLIRGLRHPVPRSRDGRAEPVDLFCERRG